LINDETKKAKKIFVEETIGTRKYFSYRTDLMLYKSVLCISIFLSIYMITSELFISILISFQVLLIFTLINKINLERKEKEGREILLTKTKKLYVKKKLNDIDIIRFEKLIKFFLEKQGYLNFKKIEKSIYSIDKSDETFYIKIFKLFDGAEVEKIDIRNFITVLGQNKAKNGFLVTTNEISEETNKFIEKLNVDIHLTVINADSLYELAEKYKLLPDNNFFYNKIYEKKAKNSNIKLKIIKNNALSNKKIVIYIFAAIFFYIISIIMPYNNLSQYISYYFIILTIVSTLYFIIMKIYQDKANKDKLLD